jgi:hypothetical protein
MITYEVDSLGYIQVENVGRVPTDPANRHYAAVLRAVEAGDAEINPYTAPE